jgi:hypothetical protein
MARPAALASRDRNPAYQEMKMTNNNAKLSENAGFGNRSPTSESAVDVEREPLPDQVPEADSDHSGAPPARSGNVAERREDLTEGDPVGNPIHHTGHVPPPVTANRD